MPRLRVYRTSLTASEPGAPGAGALDTALSHALLRAVDEGEARESLRLYAPTDAMAFSLLDRTRAGFSGAVSVAEAAGFEPILRLAGGRAALFERHALAFAWTVPSRDPRSGIRARFEALSSLIARSLCALGVDARVGEVPGEYCPGEFSVNARGAVKLMGVGQRVLRRAAHVGGVVIVRDAGRIATVLQDIYAELGLAFDPTTTGALEDEIAGASAELVADALLEEISRQREVVVEEIPQALCREAHRLAPQHGASRAESARDGSVEAGGKALLPGS